jgi:hypothetical protein
MKDALRWTVTIFVAVIFTLVLGVLWVADETSKLFRRGGSL